MNKVIIERLYPNDKRVKKQTIAHHRARYNFAASLEPARRQMALDLACGSGYGCEILKDCGYQSVLGIDISLEALEFAITNYKKEGINFNRVSLQEWCGKNSLDRYDLVTFFEAIEHIPFEDGQRVLRKVAQSLEIGGLFAMSTPRDVNDKYNEFHKSEWGYDQLKNELGNIFPNVIIYGQDWDSAEIVDDLVRENDFFIAICQKQ